MSYFSHDFMCLNDHTQGIKIAFISGGTSAVHCLAGDVDGRLYTWGRNEVRMKPLIVVVIDCCSKSVVLNVLMLVHDLQKGQLGHGNIIQRNSPRIVEGLQGKFVVAGELLELHPLEKRYRPL
jgi:hypothetical protein